MDNEQWKSALKQVGRGQHAAGDLSGEEAYALFSAMIQGRVTDLALGGLWMALRIKGESQEELRAFLAASESAYVHLRAPVESVPVIIPAYNGARLLPNLTLLLAHLIAREGVPVLLQGSLQEAGRVSSFEVFEALGGTAAKSHEEAERALAEKRLSFIPLLTLAPALARLLALRQVMGVRSSIHTVVKMLQPFTGPAVRLVSVTHPEYVKRMREFFVAEKAPVLLLRGTEGEAVAHPRRAPQMEWLYQGQVESWATVAEESPLLPASREAKVTADWIVQALDGLQPIPAAIAYQAQCCVRAARAVARSAR